MTEQKPEGSSGIGREMVGIITPEHIGEVAAIIELIRLTRGDRPCCPSCGAEFDCTAKNRLYLRKRVVCACGVTSSAFSGTLFEGTVLPPEDLLWMVDRLRFGVSPAVIALMTKSGCTPRTISNWRNSLTAAGML